MDDYGNIHPDEIRYLREAHDLKKFLKDVVNEVLDERDSMDRETHQTHHRLWEQELKRKAKNEERWEKFRTSFMGAIAVAMVAALVKLLYFLGSHFPWPK